MFVDAAVAAVAAVAVVVAIVAWMKTWETGSWSGSDMVLRPGLDPVFGAVHLGQRHASHSIESNRWP